LGRGGLPRKQVVISSAEIANLDELKRGDTTTIKVISRTGVIQEQYLLKDEQKQD
jgi:hypothetical protein